MPTFNINDIKILYEDNHIIVVEKPINLPVQEDASGDPDMLTLLKAYIKQKYNKPGNVFLGLVHRLDRPVGGVMVFARTGKAAERLSSQFKGHGVKKRYAAVVCGTAQPASSLSDWLIKGEDGTSVIATAEDSARGAKQARLDYRCVAKAEAEDGLSLSLLDIALHTGRHHQIRVQLASRGLPIWGDARYNPASRPGQQIALWAYSLSFFHPVRQTRMEFTSLPGSSGVWRHFSLPLAALEKGLQFAYLDDAIAVLNKQAGLPVTDPAEADTLETRLTAVLGRVYPVHRLDVNTTGLVCFARTQEAEEELTRAITQRKLGKFYQCLVKGCPRPAEATLRAWGVKDEKKARLYVYDEPASENSQELLTGYRVLETKEDITRLEVQLLTGRTHQIRAHLAHIGHPLLGDDKYGDREFNRLHKRSIPALCAVRLEFSFNEDSPLHYLNGKTLAIHPDF